MEIIEVVRRCQLGESQRAIARASGVARETAKKYLHGAEELGWQPMGRPPTVDLVVRLVQAGSVASAPRARASPQADRLEQQRFHSGYELREWDRVDLARLKAAIEHA